MSVNYSAVVLIGVDYDDLTFQALTDEAKEMIREDARQYSNAAYMIDGDDLRITNQDEVEKAWEEEAEELFNENKLEICHEWFGFDATIGNYFSGEIHYVGVEVVLKSDATYDREIEQVMKYVDLKPELHNGVLVW